MSTQLRMEFNLNEDLQNLRITDAEIIKRALIFAHDLPHTRPPYSKRNWGGVGHSICSYQGKLKPSIGHFLVNMFTSPGNSVYDPMSGVGTIPFEARKQNRIGIASDLSPLAVSVSSSKLEPIDFKLLKRQLGNLDKWINEFQKNDFDQIDVTFGLNGSIESYFHEDTLREIVAARVYFDKRRNKGLNSTDHFILTCLLHILHGNRPYALSRNSHPITPFKPSGNFEYKNLIEKLTKRIETITPYFMDLQENTPNGKAFQSSFENVALEDKVDAVITSPPFVDSFRFWSSNWMRLWFTGWEPTDFQSKPKDFLETKQKKSMDEYLAFSQSMAKILKTDGLMILHLGVTKNRNMAEEISAIIKNEFRTIVSVQEDVARTETHGLSDKGKKTLEHAYLFARKID